MILTIHFGKRSFLITVALLGLTFCACEKAELVDSASAPEQKTYLHISHTRTESNPEMDSTVELVEYQKYDMLWLGGDLAQATSLDEETMNYVDDFFDLDNPNTLWSLGNHDYDDLERVKEFTNRPPYYAYHSDGITFMILDTQDSLSNIVSDQKIFFNSVIDTLDSSSHLIILHHKLFWMYGNGMLEDQISTTSNGILNDCFHCINPNNFYDDLYPRLVEVQQNGIKVICLAGDIGIKVNEFEYRTWDGITFLASGVSWKKSENKALVFYHNVTNRILDWRWEWVTDL
jgi:hypothetical protein